jgi:hypothetical protein
VGDGGGEVMTDGGGVDAGFDAGPPLPVCTPKCLDWQSCEVGSTGNVCATVALQFISPDGGQIFDDGANVQFAVIATRPDGGVTSNKIPVTSESFAPMLVTSNVTASVTLPTTRHEFTLNAGWDAGLPSASVTFFSRYCDKTCAGWQECVASTSGGTCQSSGFIVDWVSPDAGAVFQTENFAGALRVTKTDGGAVSLTSVPLRGPNGATVFTGAAGEFSGTLAFAATEGSQEFVAGWEDGGPAVATSALERSDPPLLVRSGPGADQRRRE